MYRRAVTCATLLYYFDSPCGVPFFSELSRRASSTCEGTSLVVVDGSDYSTTGAGLRHTGAMQRNWNGVSCPFRHYAISWRNGHYVR